MGMHIAHALQIAMFEDALATTTFQPWLALVPVRLGRSKGWPRRSSKEATQKKDVDGEVFGSSNNQWGRPQAQSVKIQCKAGEPMQCNALLFSDYQTMQLSTGRVQFWCIVGFWWDRKCSSLVTGGTRNCFLSGLPLPQAHQHQGSMAHQQHQHHNQEGSMQHHQHWHQQLVTNFLCRQHQQHQHNTTREEWSTNSTRAAWSRQPESRL